MEVMLETLFTSVVAALGMEGIIILLLVVFVGLSLLKKLMRVAMFLASIALFIKFGLPYFHDVLKQLMG